MKTHCDCCGQLLPGSFEVDLDTNYARRDGRQVKLFPQAAVLMQALQKAGGRTVPRDELKAALWGRDSGRWPQCDDNILAGHISALRKVLPQLGVTIITVHGSGVRAVVEAA